MIAIFNARAINIATDLCPLVTVTCAMDSVTCVEKVTLAIFLLHLHG